MAWTDDPLRLACFAALAGTVAIAPPRAGAEPATVDATASVVASRSVSPETAISALLNQSTGVMTIAIPGGGAAAASNQTALFSFSNVAPISQGFLISGTGENAVVLDQLIRQLGVADGTARFDAALVTGVSATGYIDPAGFRLVVVEVVKREDGSGYLRAIVPFD